MTSKFDPENMINWISGMAATSCALSLQYNEDAYDTIRIVICQHYINNIQTWSNDLRISDSLSTHSGHEATPILSSPAMELSNLLSEIRSKKGLEDFQDLPSKDKLLDRANEETKVLLNTTAFRTDAIMISANGHIRSLPLDSSIFEEAKDYYGQLNSRISASRDMRSSSD